MAQDTDTDAAVIGRDDVDSFPQFEGDDLEFPTSADEYGSGPSAKHTDFDPDTGKQTIDSTTFDVGALTKGVSDVVTATAKVVSAASSAHKESSTSAETPKSTGSAAPKPSSSPVAKKKEDGAAGTGTAAFWAVTGLGGVLVLIAAASGLSRKRQRSPF